MNIIKNIIKYSINILWSCAKNNYRYGEQIKNPS